MSVGTGKTDAEVIAFLQSFITTDTDGKVSIDSNFATVIGTGMTGTAETADDGSAIATISDLPYGYYFVTSTVDTVLTIDSTTPNVEFEIKMVRWMLTRRSKKTPRVIIVTDT